MTAHLRLNAIYWGLTALCIMNRKDALNREEVIEFVMSCWDEEAGCTLCLLDSRFPALTHHPQALSEVTRNMMPTYTQP